MKRRSLKPKLWMLMALTAGVIIGLIIGAIIFTYRVILEREYISTLRGQLSGGLEQLEEGNFSTEAAEAVRSKGIRLLVLREPDYTVIYQGDRNEHIFRFAPPVGTYAPYGENNRDANCLWQRVLRQLGTGEGRFFATDQTQSGLKQTLESQDLYLMGRRGCHLFCLCLPVESTNAAVNLAVRYASLVGIYGWLLSIVIIYFLSRALTRPHREIAEVAAEISNLDFSRRCAPAPTRELDDLGRGVNLMADRLETAVDSLRRTNGQLQLELDERIRQQRLTTELLANLSHDLKTPIAIISGYAEGLQEGVARSADQRAVYYGMIRQESEHMLRIVQRMLSLTRLESGEIPLEIETFDLAQLVDDVLAVFQGEVERLGLEVSRDYPHPLPVCTDYESIRQSVINYVQNAVYHINGGNRIRVCTERSGDLVILRISNDSAPISPQEIPRLWEKLYRGDLARQRSRGEAGLGLCIVKGNMERLGLGYGFRNLQETGMVEFWLELPEGTDAAEK